MPDGSGIRKFFWDHWEKIVLWAGLVGLCYLLRPFFLLIFGTFLITYSIRRIVRWIQDRVNVNYRLVTGAVFILFLAALVGLGSWVGPRLIVESNQVLSNFTGSGDQQTQEKIDQFVESVISRILGQERAHAMFGSEQYATVLASVETEVAAAARAALPRVLQAILALVRLGWEILVSLLLSIVFSFILLMDWRRFMAAAHDLETSRIRSFYLGAMPHLKAFAEVIGKALQAQAIIAACNTVLTAAGLWVLGVPSIALLSTIVFFCGFVPILGTFVSSIPILLFGIQAGGLALAAKLIVVIVLVHLFEAYVLNPRITGSILHIHPLLVIVLLLVGERFFGLWGMVVGVPIGYYVISMLTRKDDNLQTPAPGSSG